MAPEVEGGGRGVDVDPEAGEGDVVIGGKGTGKAVDEDPVVDSLGPDPALSNPVEEASGLDVEGIMGCELLRPPLVPPSAPPATATGASLALPCRFDIDLLKEGNP